MKGKYRQFFVPLVLLVGGFIGLVAFVIPSWKEAFALLKKTQETEKEVTQLQNKYAILTSLDEGELRLHLANLLAAVPADKSAGSILSTVESIAGELGVSLSDITLSAIGIVATASAQTQSMHPSGASVVNFTVTVEGGVEGVRQFASQVTRVRRLLAIKSFDMTFGTTAQARIDMEAFVFPLPKELGKVGATISPISDTEAATLSQVAVLPDLRRSEALPPAALGAPKSDPFSP